MAPVAAVAPSPPKKKEKGERRAAGLGARFGRMIGDTGNLLQGQGQYIGVPLPSQADEVKILDGSAPK